MEKAYIATQIALKKQLAAADNTLDVWGIINCDNSIPLKQSLGWLLNRKYLVPHVVPRTDFTISLKVFINCKIFKWVKFKAYIATQIALKKQLAAADNTLDVWGIINYKSTLILNVVNRFE
jgi:hypothetical protein